jgi:uncharacterized protein YijF (DUF1287 family)
MILFFILSCSFTESQQANFHPSPNSPKTLYTPPPQESTRATKLAAAGESIEDSSIIYDPAYVRLDYPGGDVPKHTGVCTDVIIRAYRKIGIDLQKEVHKDILQTRSAYPNIKKPDTNIDHRRVPNLATFFTRNGTKLSSTKNPSDYKPGDIVWWKLGGPKGLNHIGLVVQKKTRTGRPLVIHNIGGGQVIEDILFSHHIHGHYRYIPK